jgi:4-alpha-glucanotransferase
MAFTPGHSGVRGRNLSADEDAHATGHGVGLYLDLAVGTHPHGAETWEDRDSFAFGASLGAPPDAFSADGQSWGLAPFNPRALVAEGFRPLAETLRCQMALSGAVRIDHILGFDRAFWVPDDGARGPMCRCPAPRCWPSFGWRPRAPVRWWWARTWATCRAGCDGALDASGILGCRLMLFERAPGRAARVPRPGPIPRTVHRQFLDPRPAHLARLARGPRDRRAAGDGRYRTRISRMPNIAQDRTRSRPSTR